jgi:hypothetical protein
LLSRPEDDSKSQGKLINAPSVLFVDVVVKIIFPQISPTDFLPEIL